MRLPWEIISHIISYSDLTTQIMFALTCTDLNREVNKFLASKNVNVYEILHQIPKGFVAYFTKYVLKLEENMIMKEIKSNGIILAYKNNKDIIEIEYAYFKFPKTLIPWKIVKHEKNGDTWYERTAYIHSDKYVSIENVFKNIELRNIKMQVDETDTMLCTRTIIETTTESWAAGLFYETPVTTKKYTFRGDELVHVL